MGQANHQTKNAGYFEVERMNLDDGDVRIYYKAKGGSDLDLDDFFKLLLKLMGYRLYSGGMDMETRTRELCFEQKVNPSEKPDLEENE